MVAQVNIVLSGIYYPMAILRYFERALKRRDDIQLLTIGPYTANWIPWDGGMYLPEKYALPPDIPLPYQPGQTSMPAGLAVAKVRERDFQPDLWIEVNAAFRFSGPLLGTRAVIATDPHAWNYAADRGEAHYLFNMQRHYAEPMDIYLPYAYDPEAHSPAPEAVNKDVDVQFVGVLYGHRKDAFDRMRAAGIHVKATTGPIFDEARELMWKSRVGFNWSSLKDLNARVFELLAMGIPSVQNWVPDIEEFFENGKHMIMTDSLDPGWMAFQVQALLNDYDLQQELIKNGLEAVQPHTYDARIEYLLDVVGGYS